MFKLVLIAAFVACASAAAVPWDACTGGLPGPASFEIPECDGTPAGQQCSVAIGQTITLRIGLNVVSVPVTSLPVTATVTTSQGSFEFPLGTANACNAMPDNGNACPTAPGVYIVVFPVELAGVTPNSEATVRVQINDQDGRVVACGAVTAHFN